ncbi:lamin tail domain-containing protein [Jiangella asiatica]|uniref:LTD domain-containing protein n=1 Tax=Jiangella asiatica TaxID=2530372 RepID=A0A4R5DY19_9ACTN|nr:lamin tail domain-containing protein [Jiangella asiatica]TDE16033.1 hypothetical protein E1269_01750 [Jiangella asiatica]
MSRSRDRIVAARRTTALAGALLTGAVLAAGAVVTAPAASSADAVADVLISEVAAGGPAGADDAFIELTNYGDAPADLDSWRIYHCGASGSRGGSPLVPPLTGVTLEPGETFVIAHRTSSLTGTADGVFSTSLADDAMGVWLEDGQAQLVDRIAVSPESRDSICGPPVPSTLDFARGQSYQRVGATGDVGVDFIRATRTPAAANADRPDPGVRAGDVLVSELANGGPGGDADEFVALTNTGADAVDVGGWRLSVCTTLGARQTAGVLTQLPAGTTLPPGEGLVVAHESASVPGGGVVVRYAEPVLAEDGFGVLVEDARGGVVDAVGVYESDAVHEPAIDSPCSQGAALPDRLDYPSGQTYRRTGNTGDNAADFTVSVPAPAENRGSGIRVSEFTHDPAAPFVELVNDGDSAVDLDGWTVDRCLANGRRALEPVAVLDGVALEPGAAHVVPLAGTPPDEAGYGFIVRDAAGRPADRVGAYFALYSPCTDGVSLVPFLDTAAGETHQRHQDTGDNVRDFVRAPASPGAIPGDLRAPADIPADELEPVDVPAAPRPEPPALLAPADGADDVSREASLSVRAGHTAGDPADVTFRGGPRLPVLENAAAVYTGTSPTAPPAERELPGESRRSAADLLRGQDGEPLVTEATEGFPYQRFELTVTGDVPDSFDVVWSGRSTGASELQLYVWNHRSQAWDLLDADAGRDGGELTLTGAVDADTGVRGRRVSVLVQDGPATRATFTGAADGSFEDPGDYDFAIGMLPDPQQLTEQFRDVHADQVSWLVRNAAARKIEYTAHVGDIVQNWMWGTHLESRARDEWQFASDAMGVLEDAGMPYGILPGNHDNKWGRDSGLFNAYFPPERFEDSAWYGDSWRPGDNVSHYDILEIDGARFLVLNLGFVAYPDRDETLGWAASVVADHPDHNVIVSTHEYLNRDAVPTRPDADRWTSLGERIWQEVVRPYDNVFLVLSGHVNGVAHAVKHDVDGVEGRVVTEVLANYQGYRADGLRDTGFLRLLQFDLDGKTMSVNTYSPSRDEHNAGEYYVGGAYGAEADEFVVPVGLGDVYDKRVETAAFALASLGEPLGAVPAADGSPAALTWPGLAAGQRYVWFTEALDAAGRAARSPLWSFTVSSP